MEKGISSMLLGKGKSDAKVTPTGRGSKISVLRKKKERKCEAG